MRGFLRLFRTGLGIALTQVWTHKLRSTLAVLGIVIGITSVTAVIGALDGLRGRVLGDFEKFGARNLTAYPNRPQTGALASAPWRRINFTADVTNGLAAAAPSVDRFSRIANRNGRVSYRDRAENYAQIRGIDPAWHVMSRRPILSGRGFGVIDVLQRRPVCLVTPKLAENLELPRDPVGTEIHLFGRPFTVVGVVDTDPAASGQFGQWGSQEEVFLPFDVLTTLRRTYTTLQIQARSPELVERAEKEVTAFLRASRGVRPGDPNPFDIHALQQMIDDFKKLAAAVTAIAGGIVSISLIVGGVGIMNVMLVSVSERTREIGLRKAVGARPAAVLFQFLVESVTLCVFGGVVGVLGGQALLEGLKRIPDAGLDAAAIPGWAVVLALGFASVVGLAFGFFPALKAARMDPIEALRHE